MNCEGEPRTDDQPVRDAEPEGADDGGQGNREEASRTPPAEENGDSQGAEVNTDDHERQEDVNNDQDVNREEGEERNEVGAESQDNSAEADPETPLTEEEQLRRRKSQMYDIHDYELLGKGVKKVVGMDLPTQCKNPVALLSCADQHMYLITDVEKNTMHVIDADREGLVKSFPYLFDYRFKGGMCNVNGVQAVALQNDNYNSVSYYDYSKDKEFKYSAFLDADANITDIASNSKGHIIALDANSKSLIIINERKSVKRKVTFDSEVIASTVAVTSDDDVCILNEADSTILVFNSHCKLTESIPLDDRLSTGCKLLRGAHDSLLILNRNRIGLYSYNGQFGYVVVDFPPNAGVRDFTVHGDTVAVLLQGHRDIAEVIVYKYHVPRAMRSPVRRRAAAKRVPPVAQPPTSSCCTIM